MLDKKDAVLAVVFLGFFALGRWSVNAPSVETKEKVKQTENSTDTKNTHTKTTITEVKKPDGSSTTTTVTDQIANDVQVTKQKTDTTIDQTITPPKKNTINISVLGANDFSRGLLVPTYGLSVTKEVLGPVTVGAFGLMNGTVGISVGLDF